MQYNIGWIIVAIVAALPLIGCGRATSAGPAGPVVAATVQRTDESGISRITLTDRAVKRLGVQVAEVKAAGEVLEAPYSALLYDASGGEWVYVSPESTVFKRAGVKVERIEGDKMYLSKGPAAGAKVVTMGAAELFGTEFEIGH